MYFNIEKRGSEVARILSNMEITDANVDLVSLYNELNIYTKQRRGLKIIFSRYSIIYSLKAILQGARIAFSSRNIFNSEALTHV